ncbi:B- and T-lymphocyte attenuator [Rhynchocyon petersi]
MSLSGRLVSHFLTLDVAEQTGNNSETLLINATSASGPHAKEMAHLWLLYSLPPLAGLALLLTACFCFLCCLRKHQEKQKKSFDSTGREINMDAVPQRFGREQTEVGPRQHSRILPSDTGIYDNDPCFGAREEPEVCSKSFMEERNKNIVYASLNHSTTSVNPRPTRDMKEAPTEYAVICVKS